VQLGLVSSLLPFAVLPLYAAVERLDHALLDAARDLYASRWRVFRHAILPQTVGALGAATALTFIPAVGMFVVPDLLGGSKAMLVGNLLQQQFFTSNDWPLGAAIASLLILLTFAGLAVVRRLQGGVGR
jgi:spermidine/putrescine transport system permease protein